MGSFNPDVWLSQQIGKPAYCLQDDELRDLPPAPCFCYAKVDEANAQLGKSLESVGFVKVETLVTYYKQGSKDGAIDPRLRQAEPGDIAEVKKIANRSFRYSRFHSDSNFDPTVANRIKESWVTNFFEGKRGHRMLVTEETQGLAGFAILLERPEKTIVDLIAVDPAFRGRGHGKALLEAAEKKARKICAGTQKKNLISCNLYESCGYKLEKSEDVFHYHNDK